MKYDLVIVGGGPTGINVAVEAKKAGLKYLILEKGMLVNSIFHFPANMTFFSTSKNLEIVDIPFISHTDKPTRREALEYYRRIVESHKLNIHYYEPVDRVMESELGGYKIISSKATYHTSNIVVATGFYDTPRMLNIPGENLPKVKHFYDEAHPYVGQKVLIIGAANSACDVALETWQKGAEVTMAIRSNEIYPKVKYWIKPNIENRISEGSIKAHFETIVKEIRAHHVVLQNAEGEWTIENDFVLAMTGYKPDYALLERLLVPIDAEDHYKPIFSAETLETTKKGIYVAGVLNCGMLTSKLFIENTREHGEMIVKSISDQS